MSQPTHEHRNGRKGAKKLDIVFLKLKNTTDNMEGNSSMKNPCFKNEDPITNASEIVYVSLMNRQISALKYPFESFENSSFVCSLTTMGFVRVCESEFP